MHQTFLSGDFQDWLNIYSANGKNISKDFAIIIETAKDPSLDDEAVKSCREYASIKCKDEIASIMGLYESQKNEIELYHTILRNHFRYGAGGNLFVILGDNKKHTLIGSKKYVIDFMEKIGFTEKAIGKVIQYCNTYNNRSTFELCLVINSMGYVSICIVHDSGKKEPISIQLASKNHIDHMYTVKKAYESYSGIFELFSLNMVTNSKLK